MYSNPGVFIPALHYSFDLYTNFYSTNIQNEGILGSKLDATLFDTGSIYSPAPTGNNYLFLFAPLTKHMTTSTSNPIILSGNSWAVCFWYWNSLYNNNYDTCIFVLSTALDTTTS